jgi:hypothetical protein
MKNNWAERVFEDKSYFFDTTESLLNYRLNTYT